MVLILHNQPLYKRTIYPIDLQEPINSQLLGYLAPTPALDTTTSTLSQWQLPIPIRQDQNDDECSLAPSLQVSCQELSISSPTSTDRSSGSCVSVSTMGSARHWSSELESEDEDTGGITPKIEELENPTIKDIKRAESPQAKFGMVRERRKRQPSKEAPSTPPCTGKVAKGRSKTGCFTCRRRKKKCDEAKPGCK